MQNTDGPTNQHSRLRICLLTYTGTEQHVDGMGLCPSNEAPCSRRNQCQKKLDAERMPIKAQRQEAGGGGPCDLALEWCGTLTRGLERHACR